MRFSDECYGIDTTLMLINIDQPTESRQIELFDFVLNKGARLICFVGWLSRNDTLLAKRIAQSENILSAYDIVEDSVSNTFFAGEYVPMFYSNERDLVTGYTFTQHDGSGRFVENLLLKTIKITTPQVYEKHKEDNEKHLINFTGTINCFFHAQDSEVSEIMDYRWKNRIVIIGCFGSMDVFSDLSVRDSINAHKVPIYNVSKRVNYYYMTDALIFANVLADQIKGNE